MLIQSQRSAIPMLPSTVYTQISTLPKKLEYEYSLRVIARQNQQSSVDIYGTQKFTLPLQASRSGGMSSGGGGSIVDVEEEDEVEPMGDEFLDLDGSGTIIGKQLMA